ncbi:MAG: hypothetical protein ACTHPD_12120 [Rhizomicrobium sp.]
MTILQIFVSSGARRDGRAELRSSFIVVSKHRSRPAIQAVTSFIAVLHNEMLANMVRGGV